VYSIFFAQNILKLKKI